MKPVLKTFFGLMLAGTCLISLAYGESLFRAGISYQTTQAYTPRSLYAVPRPATVGDMVTIKINEVSQINTQTTGTLSKQQNLQENNVQFFNNFVKRITGITQLFPEVDGLSNTHQVDVTGKLQKIYNYRDAITCQVVQVLPNGFLVVQGKKTIFANQEQQDLYVSGIVNPYFLDLQNTISSQQVANMQMQVSGKGPISRQQGDGLLGKYFQLFN